MPVDPEALRLAMRSWATGVTVVTTMHQDVNQVMTHHGMTRHGMTVNSFTSISLEPPLVLVSIERTTRTHALLELSGIFGVTILSADQQEISDCFAGRHTEIEDRFSNLSTHTLKTGAPFITGGMAFLDCVVVHQYEAGTHTLYLGEVVAVEVAEESQPLIYFKRAYRHLTD